MRMRHRGFTLLELLVAIFIATIMFAVGYGALNQAMNNHTGLKDQQDRLMEVLTAMRVIEQDMVQLAPRPIRQPIGDGWLPALVGPPADEINSEITQTGQLVISGSGLGGSSSGLSGSSSGLSGSSSGLGGSSSGLGGSSSGLGGSSSGLGGSSSGLSGSSSGLGGSSSGFGQSSSGLGQSNSQSGQSSSGLGQSSSQSGRTSDTSETAQPILQLTKGGWNNPTGVQRPGLQRVAYFFEKNTLRREYWTVLDPTLQSTMQKRDLLTHVKAVGFRFLDVNRQWQIQWPPTTVAGGTAQQSSLRIRPIAIEVTLDTEDWGKLVRIFEVAG